MEKRKKYSWEGWYVPKIALIDEKLSLEEAMVMGILAARMNADYYAWPSTKYLSDQMRRSIRSIRYYTEHLEIHGWIKIERQEGGRIKGYQVNIPPDPAKSAPCNRCPKTLQPVSSIHIQEKQLREHTAPPSAGADSPKKKIDPATLMSLAQFVRWCEKSPQKHIQIIGAWAEATNHQLETYGQWQAYMKRHLRPARDLVSFSEKQLSLAFQKVEQAMKDGWLKKPALETLLKFLT